MRNITLTDSTGNPLHSRRVSDAVWAVTAFAKVAGNRITALYSDECKLPRSRDCIHRVSQGVIRLAAKQPA